MKHSHDPPEVVHIRHADRVEYWVYGPKAGYVPLDEAYLARVSHGFRNLNERAREEARDEYLDKCTTIKKASVPRYLVNTRRSLPGKDGHRRAAAFEDFRAGALALLPVCELFSNAEAGCDLLATVLAGMRCESLREAESGFRAVVEIRSTAPEIEEALTTLAGAAVTRKKWKNGRIKRLAVLDWRTKPGGLPHRIQDFSRLKIKVKKHPTLRVPVPYIDTVALVMGADSAQLREAAPYLENAAVLLLNCGSNDWGGRRLRTSELAEYDPEVVKGLDEERYSVAALLRAWWAAEEDEVTWARQIVVEAKASFGKPDSRYISIQLDPKLLNKAIRHRVLCSFLDWLEAEGLLAGEELECYRATVKGVYDPEPVEEIPPQYAEDPPVFLRVMRNLVASKKIAGLEEPFRKGDKLLGAWRTISGECFLVMPEDGWKKAYSKAARADKDVDTTFFQRDHWESELQKILAEAEAIKVPSSGYRYRYDLYGTGKRDSTYVVAIPAGLLTEP